MNWRPPDWDVEKLVGKELTKAINGRAPSWEQLLEAGADAILDALMNISCQESIECPHTNPLCGLAVALDSKGSFEHECLICVLNSVRRTADWPTTATEIAPLASHGR